MGQILSLELNFNLPVKFINEKFKNIVEFQYILIKCRLVKIMERLIKGSLMIFVGWINFMKVVRKVVYEVRFYRIDLKTLFNEFTF